MDESVAQLPDLTSVDWHFAPDTEPGILASAETVSGRLVKRNRRRSVYRLEDPSGGGFFLKHDHPSNPRDLVKTFWRLKGQREFITSRKLFDSGIATPEPLAWGRRGVDTFVVTRELPEISEFVSAWDSCVDNPPLRRKFVAALGKFLARLLAAGIHHPDMHAGNLVVKMSDGNPSFFLLDVYGVRIRSANSPRFSVSMLCWLNGWARCLMPEERDLIFTPLVALLNAQDAIDAWRKVLASSRTASRRRWPGLRRRLLHPGSIVSAFTSDDGPWLIAKAINQQTAREAIAGHRAKIETDDLLKNDVKRRLSRVVCADRTVIVKEYIKPHGFARWRSDARAWIGTFRLFREGFPVAAPLGWLRGSDGHGYIILADGGGENLPNVLRETSSEMAGDLLDKAGKILADLHNYGICHGDTKTTNFVVAEFADAGTAELKLVDCDAVKFLRRADGGRFDAEVARFTETIPAELPETLQSAFTASYTKNRI